ncbi:MAG: CRISPR-associated endoribonuclease Cas6 [Calothrix sp. C42_A2020_038]|nr:CRISPR-associated endoribonuclease Cas6 [Calothrix sp. C42_A2020_038]
MPSTKKNLTWSKTTELVSLAFDLTPKSEATLYPQYTTGFHAWFLNQVRISNPELSAYLHDGQSEKPFTISQLEGNLLPSGKDLRIFPDQTYRWRLTALSKQVAQWFATWVTSLPDSISLRHCLLKIQKVELALPATTYRALLSSKPSVNPNMKLSFITPTSFRRKKHHFPLPVPYNIFHSYLRRWNDFSQNAVDQEAFLEWVDNNVIINRHRIESIKVPAGKSGMVTGFTGAVELSLQNSTNSNPEFEQLFYALGRLAPYCGTGHKTTFGLGETRLGWIEEIQTTSMIQSVVAQRIEELTAIFKAQRKRTGGERASNIAEKWATILARREIGESLLDISKDMNIPYESVKTYVKLARRSLKDIN